MGNGFVEAVGGIATPGFQSGSMGATPPGVSLSHLAKLLPVPEVTIQGGLKAEAKTYFADWVGDGVPAFA